MATDAKREWILFWSALPQGHFAAANRTGSFYQNYLLFKVWKTTSACARTHTHTLQENDKLIKTKHLGNRAVQPGDTTLVWQGGVKWGWWNSWGSTATRFWLWSSDRVGWAGLLIKACASSKGPDSAGTGALVSFGCDPALKFVSFEIVCLSTFFDVKQAGSMNPISIADLIKSADRICVHGVESLYRQKYWQSLRYGRRHHHTDVCTQSHTFASTL